jgi:hypothetical protein
MQSTRHFKFARAGWIANAVLACSGFLQLLPTFEGDIYGAGLLVVLFISPWLLIYGLSLALYATIRWKLLEPRQRWYLFSVILLFPVSFGLFLSILTARNLLLEESP